MEKRFHLNPKNNCWNCTHVNLNWQKCKIGLSDNIANSSSYECPHWIPNGQLEEEAKIVMNIN